MNSYSAIVYCHLTTLMDPVQKHFLRSNVLGTNQILRLPLEDHQVYGVSPAKES